MAAKKKAAAAEAAPKASKAKKPAKKKAAAAKGAKDAVSGVVTGDNVGIGHNTKIPTKKELEGFKSRLDKLFEEKAEKNATFMSDIKGVYGEMASKFGTSRKIARMFYNIAKSQESLADEFAEFEAKEREDMDRLIAAGQSFGKDTPFGAWCLAQGEIEIPDDAPKAEIVQPAPKQSAAEAALAAIENENKAPVH